MGPSQLEARSSKLKLQAYSLADSDQRRQSRSVHIPGIHVGNGKWEKTCEEMRKHALHAATRGNTRKHAETRPLRRLPRKGPDQALCRLPLLQLILRERFRQANQMAVCSPAAPCPSLKSKSEERMIQNSNKCGKNTPDSDLPGLLRAPPARLQRSTSPGSPTPLRERQRASWPFCALGCGRNEPVAKPPT